MRILFVTQFFDPEPVMKGIIFARELQHVTGGSVTVATGFPNYPTGKIYPGYRLKPVARETMGDVEVIRLPIIPGHGRNPLSRAANYLSFFTSLLTWGLFSVRKYDVIYVYHPPMTVGLAVALFAGLHRKPFAIEVQDLWPESVVASGISGVGTLGRALGAMCTFVYRRAAAVVAQSRGMAEQLIERGANPDTTSVVYNWSNSEEPAPPRAAAGDTYEFLYTGNIGIYQQLDTVIASARIAHAADPRIRLTMIGSGAEKDRLVDSLSAGDREFISFRDSVPQSELLSVVAAADCLLLHLRDMPFFEFTLPSKIPFYLAMGKPVLAGIRGEAAEILNASGAAEIVPPETPVAMADAMLALARESGERQIERGHRAVDYYASHLSLKQGIRQTAEVIERIAP